MINSRKTGQKLNADKQALREERDAILALLGQKAKEAFAPAFAQAQFDLAA